MAYKLERNNGTKGLCCRFEHSGYTECSIYPEDELDVVYGKWDVSVTEEGLLSCIEEFVRMKEETK
ncbi:hypothetical protein [Selenomonas noxia]|uniref:hypothetical protein n=1 Tax=Selenomonas noxia TaxID=135083 RepID=UPI0028802631|nr:hypothetical protein [Selenomonas noxia]